MGCAEGAANTQTIAQFERAGLEAVAHKQWGKVYDTMHPAQRRLVTYKDFFKCMTAGAFLAESFGIDLSTTRFVSAKVVKQKRVTLPETKVQMTATVVRVSSSFVEGGKRVTDSDLEYVVKINGQWRWIDLDTKPSEYRRHTCGIK